MFCQSNQFDRREHLLYSLYFSCFEPKQFFGKMFVYFLYFFGLCIVLFVLGLLWKWNTPTTAKKIDNMSLGPLWNLNIVWEHDFDQVRAGVFQLSYGSFATRVLPDHQLWVWNGSNVNIEFCFFVSAKSTLQSFKA